MKKSIITIASIVLLAAGCGTQTPTPAATSQTPPAQQQPAQTNQQNNLSQTPMNKELKTQLEAASEDALKPIFDDKDPNQFPLKFVDAVQVGNHAAYVKSQQPDQGSINYALLHYDLENGGWNQFGQDSDNFLFVNPDPKSPENIQGMKDKVLAMEDGYFSKEAAIDLHDALEAADMDTAKALLAQNSQVNLESLLAKYPILKDNAGYSVYGQKVTSPNATLKMQIIGKDKVSKHADFGLLKENGVWKITNITFED
jgi:hypothetical protein